MQEIKNTLTEMKNVFYRFIIRLAEETINGLQDKSWEITGHEIQTYFFLIGVGENGKQNRTETPRIVGIYQMNYNACKWNPTRSGISGTEEILE